MHLEYLSSFFESHLTISSLLAPDLGQRTEEEGHAELRHADVAADDGFASRTSS